MAKKAAAKPVEPEEIANAQDDVREDEDFSQESPDDDVTPEQTRHDEENFKLNGSPSKAEMVRSAVTAGMESPGEGTAWIKEHYGVDLPKPMWSSYRAQAKAREAKAGGNYTPTPRASSQPSTQTFGIPPSFGQDIKRIKELVEKAGGGEALKELSNSLASLTQKYGQGGLDSIIDAFE